MSHTWDMNRINNETMMFKAGRGPKGVMDRRATPCNEHSSAHMPSSYRGRERPIVSIATVETALNVIHLDRFASPPSVGSIFAASVLWYGPLGP